MKIIDIILYIILFLATLCYAILKIIKNINKEKGLGKESIVYRDVKNDFKKNSNSLKDSNYSGFKEKLKEYGDDNLYHAIAVVSGDLKTIDVEAINGAVLIVIFTSVSNIITGRLTSNMLGEISTDMLSNCIIVVFAGLYMLAILSNYTNVKWQEYFIKIVQVELERREKEQAGKIELLEKQEKENAQLKIKIENLEKEVRDLKKKEKKVEFIIWK